jgi:hypothetical protein
MTVEARQIAWARENLIYRSTPDFKPLLADIRERHFEKFGQPISDRDLSIASVPWAWMFRADAKEYYRHSVSEEWRVLAV